MYKVDERRCDCCNRKTSLSPAGGYNFCSFECACYSGKYSIIHGWSKDDSPIIKTPPKQAWWMTDEQYEKFLADIGWFWNSEKRKWELNENG